MSDVRIDKVTKRYGPETILDGVELVAPDGELVVLVGPSGCGKSTLLRTVAGLIYPDEGRVLIGERDVTKLPPRERDLAMVFQSYALYPHLRVKENIAFGLKLRKESQSTIDKRVSEVTSMLGIEALLDRFPRELSGGQRQRVAMGRAIARRPNVFLFDEPLSNLDAKLRNSVRVEIKALHQELNTTTLYVTHDQVEAMTLADRLVVLSGGVVQQVGPPLEIFERPANTFVAGFMGSPPMNLLEVEGREGSLVGEGVRIETRSSARGLLVMGVRPHQLVPTDGDADLTMNVRVVEALGAESLVHGRVGDADIVVSVESGSRPAVGEVLKLSIAVGGLHLFERASGVRIDA